MLARSHNPLLRQQRTCVCISAWIFVTNRRIHWLCSIRVQALDMAGCMTNPPPGNASIGLLLMPASRVPYVCFSTYPPPSAQGSFWYPWYPSHVKTVHVAMTRYAYHPPLPSPQPLTPHDSVIGLSCPITAQRYTKCLLRL